MFATLTRFWKEQNIWLVAILFAVPVLFPSLDAKASGEVITAFSEQTQDHNLVSLPKPDPRVEVLQVTRPRQLMRRWVGWNNPNWTLAVEQSLSDFRELGLLEPHLEQIAER